MAETTKFREYVEDLIYKFTSRSMYEENIDIIDIGSGDDPLTEFVDTFDLPIPYTKNTKIDKLTYKGDARNILKIVDKKYDVVYSSHLLEDFDRSETIPVLRDWVKLLKKNGILILLLPDQAKYLIRCLRIKEAPNEHHKIDEFSLSYILDCFSKIDDVEVIFSHEFFMDVLLEYNFIVVVRNKFYGNFAI